MTCLRAHGWKWTVSLEPHECKPTAHKQMLRWPGGFSGFGDLGGFGGVSSIAGDSSGYKEELEGQARTHKQQRRMRLAEERYALGKQRSSHGAS